MFGYVTPLKGELKVREYEIFRSYYCGVCNSIKKQFGNLPRMTLNYDMTFLAILLDSLDTKKIEVVHKPCIAHPLSKRNILINSNATDYAAAMNISLFYYKVLDDYKDDKNLKSYGFYLGLLPYKKKILINYKEINDIIEENLNILSKYEEEKNFLSIDEIAHPFSVIVGEILKSYPNLHKENLILKDDLYNLGYSLGKWIYLIDALDDLKEDIEKNKFNPLNHLFNKDCLSYEQLYDKIIERMEFNILSLGNRTLEYLNILDLHKNKELLENIITLGLMDKFEKVKGRNNNESI